ncbi:hypothetical protein LDG_6320 [Legionella drancourtii LLAP12]|uniref:Uncharacterized protein n=1 Tax=Legionella drancourtii LLAP12 TaxID=658187 RepID=G9EM58_9GAMM|nr:hypothetical protein LDG_6320 [Legionella drancourtii LLAP12]
MWVIGVKNYIIFKNAPLPDLKNRLILSQILGRSIYLFRRVAYAKISAVGTQC